MTADTRRNVAAKRDYKVPARALAHQAFSRAAGAPLLDGNAVRLLRNAQENYPAWLDAIHGARHHIHFESYIIHEDDTGREFAQALITRAKQGVAVRVVYDWVGGLGKTSGSFWRSLRDGGVEVRCYNPPRLDSPFGWLSRDHRKMIEVDGDIAFISGLCVGKAWVGDPAQNIDPWRDTGVEIRGTAVEEVAQAFARMWALLGDPLPEDSLARNTSGPAGETRVRVVATIPMTAGISRVDEMVAGLSQKRLWLTDAYYAGTTSYVQALTAAAKDGVDVRLLVPNGTDIPLLRPISRAGYRPLLDAGVRIFEWNGPMLHAKTAVADGNWARVGSSNLNVWSWFGNCELDLIVEDENFGREMEEMYLQDLTQATELVLDGRDRVLRVPQEGQLDPRRRSRGGSAGKAAAGALRLSSAVGAALTNRRVFEPVEDRILLATSGLLIGLAFLFLKFPAVLHYPVIVLLLWFGVAILIKACRLFWERRRRRSTGSESAEVGKSDEGRI
jgi:cardiolipin synthase